MPAALCALMPGSLNYATVTCERESGVRPGARRSRPPAGRHAGGRRRNSGREADLRLTLCIVTRRKAQGARRKGQATRHKARGMAGWSWRWTSHGGFGWTPQPARVVRSAMPGRGQDEHWMLPGWPYSAVAALETSRTSGWHWSMVSVDSTTCGPTSTPPGPAGACRGYRGRRTPRQQRPDEGLGCSRGGLTCKIHLAGECGRRPMALLVTSELLVSGAMPLSSSRSWNAYASAGRVADTHGPGLTTSAANMAYSSRRNRRYLR